MRFLDTSLFFLTLMVSGLTAGYELRAWNLTGLGSPKVYRVWLGDGQTYVGRTVPPEVKVAFNFTVREDRRQLMYIEVDRDNSPSGAPDLPNPTFMVANAGAGSKDNLYYAHSAVDMTQDNVYMFNGLDGFLWPTIRSGIAPGSAYMVPTSVDGTYAIKWIRDADSAVAMKGIEVTLTSRN
jgi:hypothetical protein